MLRLNCRHQTVIGVVRKSELALFFLHSCELLNFKRMNTEIPRR